LFHHRCAAFTRRFIIRQGLRHLLAIPLDHREVKRVIHFAFKSAGRGGLFHPTADLADDIQCQCIAGLHRFHQFGLQILFDPHGNLHPGNCACPEAGV
jgi:hypothetical protein